MQAVEEKIIIYFATLLYNMLHLCNNMSYNQTNSRNQCSKTLINMIQEITTLYKYGFVYKDVKNKRSYALKEIPINCFKSTLVANIQREKLTINKLKKLTFEINYSVVSFVENEMPF
jgi:hypothetical protein